MVTGTKKGKENGQGKGREEGVSLSALKNRITLITLFYLKQKYVKNSDKKTVFIVFSKYFVGTQIPNISGI